MILAGFSYTCAAVAMAILAGLLTTRYRHSDLARRVAVVAAVTAVWATLLAFSARLGDRREWIGIAAGALRHAGWLFALAAPNGRRFHPWIVRAVFLLCAALFMVAIVGAVFVFPAGSYLDPVKLRNASALLLACAGLVLTEQVMRNATVGSSRGVRMLIVGAGGQ